MFWKTSSSSSSSSSSRSDSSDSSSRAEEDNDRVVDLLLSCSAAELEKWYNGSSVWSRVPGPFKFSLVKFSW